MTGAPEEVYEPWGHLKKWPQWLRTILLGEHPPFDYLKTLEAWYELGESEQTRLKETVPDEITDRAESLKTFRDNVKVTATILGFVLGGLVTGFVLRPHGVSALLLALSVTFVTIAVLILMRAIIPPPHVIFTNFDHPFDWVKGERGRPAQSEDELFVAKSIDALLKANHITQFIKRSLVYATVVAAFGFLGLVSYLYVEFVF